MKNNQTRRHRWYFYPGIVLLALVLLFGGFLGWLTATEYRPEPVEPAAVGGFRDGPVFGGDSLRVLSFNMGYASLGQSSDFVMDGGRGPGQTDRETMEANMTGIADILTGADVYMLQEIDRPSHRTFGVNQLEAFEAVLPEHGWSYAPNFLCRFVPFPPQKPFGAIDSGVATYVPWQVEEAQRIALPNPFSWPLRIANLKRCMLRTEIPLTDSDKKLIIVNFHLEAYDDGAGKAAQTQQVLQLIREEYDRGNYVIAGGDFNQIFPGVDTVVKPTSEWVPGRLDPLPPEMEDWNLVCDDSTPTCRLLNQPYDPGSELTQYYVIDGFIVSPNLEVQQMTTLDAGFRCSDHNPVLLEVTLK